MTTEQLRASFLQAAIQGRLVPQDPADGNAADLLAAIRAERERLIKEKKLRKSKPLPPIDPDEIPFQIPDSWQWVRLGEICMLADGSWKVGESHPILDVKYLRGQASQKMSSSGRFVVRGNFIILVDGENSGEVFTVCEDGYMGSTFKQLSIVQELSAAYILVFLDVYRKRLRESKIGSAIPHLNRKLFFNLPIPLPPLAEQERIVAKLDDCLALCEAYAERERLDLDFGMGMRKSLLQAAIRGELLPQDPADGNAADLLAAIRAERERLIKEKKLRKSKPLPPIDPDEIPFQIPDSWQWVRLGEVVRLKMGKTPARAEPEWWGAGIPWVSISDMPDGGHVQKTRESISKAALTSVFKDHVSPVGTLLMSFKLTIGKVAILDIPAVHNEAIVSIEPFEAAPIRDFLYFVLPFLVQFGERKRAIKGDTLNGESLSRLLIPLPPLAEQERIVTKLGELLPLCTPSA